METKEGMSVDEVTGKKKSFTIKGLMENMYYDVVVRAYRNRTSEVVCQVTVKTKREGKNYVLLSRNKIVSWLIKKLKSFLKPKQKPGVYLWFLNANRKSFLNSSAAERGLDTELLRMENWFKLCFKRWS